MIDLSEKNRVKLKKNDIDSASKSVLFEYLSVQKCLTFRRSIAKSILHLSAGSKYQVLSFLVVETNSLPICLQWQAI